jgi:acyl-coenzyme A synthetase/AMP-(fatty) acid ligase
VNFRLVGAEIAYIVENCEAAAFIVEDALVETVDQVRAELSVPAQNFIQLGSGRCPGYRAYEDLLAAARDDEPDVKVSPADPWTLMYTSGSTGRPKGAIRSHLGGANLSLVTEVEMNLDRDDAALLVMPMCHGNSLYFFDAFTYCGAPCTVYSRKSFDPEHLLRTLADCGASFTSLVPTHYIMMLGLSRAVLERYDVSQVRKLMVSSAPARRDTKLAIMEYSNSGLYELYGSTEAGWVTMLHPDEQFTKLGSVGRECVGSAGAEGAGHGGIVGVTQRRADDAAPVVGLLVVALDVPGGIVGDNEHSLGAVAHGGVDFHGVDPEGAVSID